MKTDEGTLREEELKNQNEKKEQQKLKNEAQSAFRKAAPELMDKTVKPIISTIIHKLTEIGYKSFAGITGINTIYSESPAQYTFNVEYGTCRVKIDIVANVATQAFDFKPTFSPENIKLTSEKGLKVDELTEQNVIAFLFQKIEAMKEWEIVKSK